MCDCPRFENENERWVAHTVTCRMERMAATEMALLADRKRVMNKQAVSQMLANLTPADVSRLMKGGK